VAHAVQSPPGIDSLDPVQIGRIEQWIEVRGKNVSNPILLFLHGSPGMLSYHSQARSKGRGKSISQWFSGTSGAQERLTLLTLEELVEQTSR
jgi:hypothetical protein